MLLAIIRGQSNEHPQHRILRGTDKNYYFNYHQIHTLSVLLRMYLLTGPLSQQQIFQTCFLMLYMLQSCVQNGMQLDIHVHFVRLPPFLKEYAHKN